MSSGPRSKIVPALIGESERTAQLRAAAGRPELAAISEIRSADYPTDVVVAQSPPPASRGARSRCW